MIETDALVIGAGPVGIFQAFQLGLLEISCHVVDSLPHPGGQCIELYPDKPIYDIPGTPRCTGRELVASLLKQVEPFQPSFHLGQEVSRLEKQPDGRFLVETSRGAVFLAKAVLVAAGVGAFQPKRLKVEGLDAFEGRQLFYRVDDAPALGGKHLLVVGGDEAAVEGALRFASATSERPASVTLLHRRDVLQAPAEALARVAALRASGQLQFRVGQVTACDAQDGVLKSVQVTGSEGNTDTLAVDAVLVLLGLSPKLGPVAHWGLDMERKQVRVDTEAFATGVPGIFAVGDINTYPGKKKLILSGFHEAALAAFGVAAIVFPDRKTPLQYTTTSPRLHKLLGVDAPSPDGA
ncbi:MAG: trxB [Polaromonas sp.]|nr:trxB [Polaromonas sp.]